MNRTEAFRRLGATPKNVRNSWSALKDDGSGVVVTAWSERFDWHARPVTYDGSFVNDDAAARPGARERINHLRFAIERCSGVVDVVRGTRDPSAPELRGENWDVPGLAFRITSFDGVTGAFQAEVLGGRGTTSP